MAEIPKPNGNISGPKYQSFGFISIGPSGAGKSTMSHGISEFYK